MEEEVKEKRSLYDQKLKRYDRPSGPSHTDVMREQTLVNQAAIENALKENCEEYGLQVPDRKGDHQIYECLTQAVQKRLENIIDNLVRIRRHRSETETLSKDTKAVKGQQIAFVGDRPKKVLAVLRMRRKEREDLDLRRKAALARREADAEEEGRAPADEHQDDLKARELQASESNVALREFTRGQGRQLGFTSRGTAAYMKDRGSSGGFKSASAGAGIGAAAAAVSARAPAAGKVTLADVLLYLENAPIVTNKMAALLYRAYLAERYEQPSAENIKTLQKLRRSVEIVAKHPKPFSEFKCLGVRRIDDTYFFLVLVDGGKRLSVTVRAGDVQEACYEDKL